ncbi:tyrosine-protein phosphatase [Lacinutrix mariniflava]|uniref:tyrosine-protein phosphatase n=1 Tax=Lacinutrix mariniflava TaxID=342955 RepID=UPI0006E289C7|nr:tyrosine-protein phosphatase [Lacinutrix mariniflava]
MRNFRDSAKFNLKLKKAIIYRASVFDLLDNNKLLEGKKIKTIIDLRADREIEAISYSEDLLSKVNYVKAQFDPWNQPEWFKEKHNVGSNHEIAYRFFAMGCKNAVKKTFETILEHKSGTIAIHCHAGKDRTGIVFSMLHLLLGSSIENLYTDYLASEMDVSKEKLNIALDIIEKEGGIEAYLLTCGLTENQIINIKQKLLNE